MILAIENFNGPFCDGIDGWVWVTDGVGGDTDEIIVLFADSMMGLFDVNGTPIGLHGCMPLEICRLKKKKKWKMERKK